LGMTFTIRLAAGHCANSLFFTALETTDRRSAFKYSRICFLGIRATFTTIFPASGFIRAKTGSQKVLVIRISAAGSARVIPREYMASLSRSRDRKRDLLNFIRRTYRNRPSKPISSTWEGWDLERKVTWWPDSAKSLPTSCHLRSTAPHPAGGRGLNGPVTIVMRIEKTLNRSIYLWWSRLACKAQSTGILASFLPCCQF